MALADDVRSLRDEALGDLAIAYDYHTDTRFAWRIVHKVIAAGHTITIRNMTTGTITTQAELAARARGYVAEQLTEATFQQFLAIFENFFHDLLQCWLVTYPLSLGKKMVDLKTILELPDRAAVTRLIVGKELNEVLYGRPTEWFAYLEDKIHLGCPSVGEIERFAEAKASRDALVHGKGVATKIYVAKAGALARSVRATESASRNPTTARPGTWSAR